SISIDGELPRSGERLRLVSCFNGAVDKYRRRAPLVVVARGTAHNRASMGPSISIDGEFGAGTHDKRDHQASMGPSISIDGAHSIGARLLARLPDASMGRSISIDGERA